MVIIGGILAKDIQSMYYGQGESDLDLNHDANFNNADESIKYLLYHHYQYQKNIYKS